eukprot:TRINITY_DN124_c0_g1_i3.p1 TRINITY_DN124_c0_g1~~TRINITY_DN124_c0_g1_i3.p1  ORF type:complete len:438 (+),score=122.35 TRINITY_DN124_c0_g1_i3:62-1375(+)
MTSSDLEPADFVQLLQGSESMPPSEVEEPTTKALINAIFDPSTRDNTEKLESVSVLSFSNSWCFWMDRNKPGVITPEDFKKGLRVIEEEVHNIKSFCKVWSDISKSEPFTLYFNIRLFKKGVEPMWEDPANLNGGKFILGFPVNFEEEGDTIPDDGIRTYLTLLVNMVVGQICDVAELCGAGLQIRPKGLIITLWNKDCKNSKLIDATLDRLKDLLSLENVRYSSHEVSKESKEKPQPKSSTRGGRSGTGGAAGGRSRGSGGGGGRGRGGDNHGHGQNKSHSNKQQQEKSSPVKVHIPKAPETNPWTKKKLDLEENTSGDGGGASWEEITQGGNSGKKQPNATSSSSDKATSKSALVLPTSTLMSRSMVCYNLFYLNMIHCPSSSSSSPSSSLSLFTHHRTTIDDVGVDDDITLPRSCSKYVGVFSLFIFLLFVVQK